MPAQPLMLSLFLTIFLVGCIDSSTEPGNTPRLSMSLVSGGTQRATVNTQLSAPVVVRIVDLSQAGAVVPNYPLNWVASDGGSVFAATTLTGTNGNAQNFWTLGGKVGTQTLEVHVIDANGNPLTLGSVSAIGVAEATISYLRITATTPLAADSTRNVSLISYGSDSLPIGNVTIDWFVYFVYPYYPYISNEQEGITDANGHYSFTWKATHAGWNYVQIQGYKCPPGGGLCQMSNVVKDSAFVQ
jgi:hypothetical protein